MLLWFGGADNKMTWPRAVLGDVAVDNAKRAARAKLFYNRGLPENETSCIDHQCKISLLNPVRPLVEGQLSLGLKNNFKIHLELNLLISHL